MIRTKGQFYWIDALYLARGRDDLILKNREGSREVLRCRFCGAFMLYESTQREGGRWQRLRPYEQYRLTVTHGDLEKTRLRVVQTQGEKELCQCEVCASHWWKDKQGCTKADDGMIDQSNTQKGEH